MRFQSPPAVQLLWVRQPVEFLVLNPRIQMSKDLAAWQANSSHSLAALLGLCLRESADSLNLLPQELKNENRRMLRRATLLKGLLFIIVILITCGLGVAKHLDNKALYLARLKAEMNKISQQARPLEDIERRFDLLESRAMNKPSSLDILHELHLVVPPQLTLVSLSYEEGKQVLLRGQSLELNSIFALVEQLERSLVLEDFNIKVRYATKKRTSSGDLVDFEIECLKK